MLCESEVSCIIYILQQIKFHSALDTRLSTNTNPTLSVQIREDLRHAGVSIYLLNSQEEHEEDAETNDAHRVR